MVLASRGDRPADGRPAAHLEHGEAYNLRAVVAEEAIIIRAEGLCVSA
jgi:hypothetical protein